LTFGTLVLVFDDRGFVVVVSSLNFEDLEKHYFLTKKTLIHHVLFINHV
jgi:hypothetical protein